MVLKKIEKKRLKLNGKIVVLDKNVQQCFEGFLQSIPHTTIEFYESDLNKWVEM